MQTVKIQSIDGTVFSNVFLGDKKLEGIREITFNQSVDTIPCFTFETVGLPDIEIDNADICFKFTPETISDSVKVIYHTYEIDNDFRNAFIASIESAIHDNGVVCDISDQHDLATEIANRIMGD